MASDFSRKSDLGKCCDPSRDDRPLSRRAFGLAAGRTALGLFGLSLILTVTTSHATRQLTMKITRLRIRLARWKEIPATAENDYPAEAIRAGDKFYYRAKGVTVPITAYEFQMVVANPFTYYFSTALKLELKIKRAKEEFDSVLLGQRPAN